MLGADVRAQKIEDLRKCDQRNDSETHAERVDTRSVIAEATSHPQLDKTYSEQHDRLPRSHQRYF
jgi:hypothetical protein